MLNSEEPKPGVSRDQRGVVSTVALRGSLLLLALSACVPGAQSTPGPELPRRVTVRFAWLLRAYNLPLVVAKEKGFFLNRGLDVVLNEGKGDSVACELVSSGQQDFGQADASTAAVLISKGAAVRYVTVFLQRNPSSIIFHPEQKIVSPSDLQGKRGGVSPAGAATVLLEAVLAKHRIPRQRLYLTAMDPRAKHAALLGRQVDYINGYINGDYASVSMAAPEIEALPYYQWDVNALSLGLMTHPETIARKPDLVRDFVTATLEGWHYTLEHPQEASAIGVKHFPLADRRLLEAGLKNTAPLLHTPHSRNKPLGWMAEEDWRQTVETMQRYGGSAPPKPLEQYYTNQFLE